MNNYDKQVEKLISASGEGRLNEVIDYINNGVKINAIGFNYSNALHQACCCGQVVIVDALLSAGANPNIKTKNNKQETPLILTLNTIYYTYHKINGTNAQLQITKRLIEAGADIDLKDEDGNTALTYAIDDARNRVILSTLIKAGVNVNVQNNEGCTALMIACGIWAVPIDFVKILLDSGANIDTQDKEGKTALIYTIQEPKFLEKIRLQLEKVQLLIEAGADVNVKDNDGNTALSLAKEVGNTEIVQLLFEAGAK